jgi:hypothetical protein
MGAAAGAGKVGLGGGGEGEGEKKEGGKNEEGKKEEGRRRVSGAAVGEELRQMQKGVSVRVHVKSSDFASPFFPVVVLPYPPYMHTHFSLCYPTHHTCTK